MRRPTFAQSTCPWSCLIAIFMPLLLPAAEPLPSRPGSSLTLIPPSPVSDKILLDVRGAVWDWTASAQDYSVRVYLDSEEPKMLLHERTLRVAPGKAEGLRFRWPAAGRAGKHRLILIADAGVDRHEASRPLEILERPHRTTGSIDGAWFEFYHWSEAEGRLWNREIATLTDEQWKELIAGMNGVGLNTVVIQDTFYNPDRYVGKHSMGRDGFPGKAYYPSRLYPKLERIAADDPLEAVLAEADRHGMNVFVGVGNYAWFDFTADSLAWHKNVADELWRKYGHHQSFYGWYISAEIAGNLGTDDLRREELVRFFEGFKEHAARLAPDKPVMLATNCHSIRDSNGYYPRLLAHLDILCPFGFDRMPAGDITGEEAAAILQEYCDEAGSHLWMDMEVFLFGEGNALYPRPIIGIISDLRRFPDFEKILCYSYTGLLNAPEQSRHPGGPATVQLYRDYRKYLRHGEDAFLAQHAARGCKATSAPAPDNRYASGDLTDGRLGGTDYRCGAWLGFQHTGAEITVDLGKPTSIQDIDIGCLQFTRAGIVLPGQITLESSPDGRTFAPLARIETDIPPTEAGPLRHVFRAEAIDATTRYLRAKLKRGGEWLFVDEIIVNPRRIAN